MTVRNLEVPLPKKTLLLSCGSLCRDFSRLVFDLRPSGSSADCSNVCEAPSDGANSMVCIGQLQHYRGGMRTELMRNFWRIFRGGRQESRRRPIRQSPTHPGFEEDVRILQLLKPRLPERPVILDVGASNGRWTREILKTFPGATVFLFEPGTAYTGEMQATLDSHERLKLFPIAIGERDGPVTFMCTPTHKGQPPSIGRKETSQRRLRCR